MSPTYRSHVFHISHIHPLSRPFYYRITGLDPAHPYHTHLELPPTLDDTDAIFVDVIHSDNTSILGFPMSNNNNNINDILIMNFS